MKYLINTCISSFLILFILVFATNAEENKKKFEEKKKKKFEERLKNMRPEVKDHIFSEIDDGDGVLDDKEREEVMKMMRQTAKRLRTNLVAEEIPSAVVAGKESAAAETACPRSLPWTSPRLHPAASRMKIKMRHTCSKGERVPNF